MIAHALEIIQNELKANLLTYTDNYAGVGNSDGLTVTLNNIASLNVSQAMEPNTQSDILITLVNFREEKSLKNLPNYVRNDAALKVTYENPPVFVNLHVLFSVIVNNYPIALSALSRIIRFFQSRNVFTQDTVAPASLNTLVSADDQLESFKMIMDLYSPSFEEMNHLWGTLGGKQYPFALYTLRMLDLKYKSVQNESGLITEVVSNFYNKNTVAN